MTQIHSDNNQHIKLLNDDIVTNGCFVCFEDDQKKYEVCRHCLLGVCRHSECVDVFPHIDNTEYLICADCKFTIEKKLKPIVYTEKEQYEEKMEKQHKQKLLRQAEAEKVCYENTLMYIKLLHIIQ
tara:strand:- start:1576 stop:1953 length:378 start_codon:yes stop_codon:yes gene_type:complete